jgi:hypothetical protein
MTMSKTQEKIIRPAGAFPDTKEGWKQYEDQWPEEKMEIRSYLMCHIDKPNPEFVDVHKNNNGYVVSVKNEITLFLSNYDELCIFGHAITDGINKLRDIDKEIEARQEMKILEDEEDGNN